MHNNSDASLYPLAFAANATRQSGNRTWITCGGVNTQTRNCEALLGHGRGTSPFPSQVLYPDAVPVSQKPGLTWPAYVQHLHGHAFLPL